MKTLFALILSLATLHAANLDGKWSVIPRRGAAPHIYTFRSEGGTLKGSRVVGTITQEFQNGRVNGNELSFSIDLTLPQTPDNKIIMLYKGTLTGDEIKLTEQRERMPDGQPGTVRSFIATRVP